MNKENVKAWAKKKADDTKNWVGTQLWRAGQWAKENPEQATIAGATAVWAIKTMITRSYQSTKIRREQRLKEEFIYDRSLGRYWKLRRKPTQSEQLAIESMRKQGLGYGDILTRLKLL